MPYAPGTILRGSGRANYGAYRIIRQLPEQREAYEVEIIELRAGRGGVHSVGDHVERTRSHLDEFNYEPDTSPDSREEVKMKIHNLIHNSPDVPTPVSAVTMPEAAYGTIRTTRWFSGDTWLIEEEPEFEITAGEPVLVEFSDGSLGKCSEANLAAALATFDLQLVTS